jgi:hypothetical protein
MNKDAVRDWQQALRRGFLSSPSVGDQDLTRRWTRNREALRLPVVFVWRRGKEADVVWLPESFRRPAHDELEWLERCERVLKEGQRYLIAFEGASGGQEDEWWFIRLPIVEAVRFAEWIVAETTPSEEVPVAA